MNTLCGVRKPFVVTFRDFSHIKIEFITNNDSRVARGYVAGYMAYKTGKGNLSPSGYQGFQMSSLPHCLLNRPFPSCCESHLNFPNEN